MLDEVENPVEAPLDVEEPGSAAVVELELVVAAEGPGPSELSDCPDEDPPSVPRATDGPQASREARGSSSIVRIAQGYQSKHSKHNDSRRVTGSAGGRMGA